jgi:hypothetical protein
LVGSSSDGLVAWCTEAGREGSSFRKLCFEMAHLDSALQLHRSE